MNNVCLIGNLTRDPELKQSNTGIKYTKFTIAVNNGTRKDGSDNTAFITISVFNRQAEVICNYLTKGSKIAVNGSIVTGSYKNKNGDTVYTFEVMANHVEFLNTRNSEESARPGKPDVQMAFSEEDTDIPW